MGSRITSEYSEDGRAVHRGKRVTVRRSPHAKRGYIDHTPYDTTSIIKFITRRFALEPLPGVRDGAGDLLNAFDFVR